MEIRTGSDCNDSEYNLVLKHDKASLMRQLNANIVFSPTDELAVNAVAPSVGKAAKQALQSKSRNPVAGSQEHASNKFVARNDPYQNAFADKIVVRTSSEKRVSNNSKLTLSDGMFVSAFVIVLARLIVTAFVTQRWSFLTAVACVVSTSLTAV